jgi:hypothetical protein
MQQTRLQHATKNEPRTAAGNVPLLLSAVRYPSGSEAGARNNCPSAPHTTARTAVLYRTARVAGDTARREREDETRVPLSRAVDIPGTNRSVAPPPRPPLPPRASGEETAGVEAAPAPPSPRRPAATRDPVEPRCAAGATGDDERRDSRSSMACKQRH